MQDSYLNIYNKVNKCESSCLCKQQAYNSLHKQALSLNAAKPIAKALRLWKRLAFGLGITGAAGLGLTGYSAASNAIQAGKLNKQLVGANAQIAKYKQALNKQNSTGLSWPQLLSGIAIGGVGLWGAKQAYDALTKKPKKKKPTKAQPEQRQLQQQEQE